MAQADIVHALVNSYANQQPFVVFSHPNSQEVEAYFQLDEILHKADTLEDSFILAPFNQQEESYAIPFAKADYFWAKMKFEAFEEAAVDRDRPEVDALQHQVLVSKGINFIQANKAQKIVLAREESVVLVDIDLELLFKRLFNLYPTAFRYIWYHPKTGIWCGATPETLIQTQGDSYFTMALAGTMPYKGFEPNWRTKEREEQQFVTDTIVASIKDLVADMEVSETYTQAAGTIAHLRTDIQGKILSSTSVIDLAQAIHPTPAICGTPTKVAREFILKEEHFKRRFYAGYLGVISAQETSRLYVNLRSMQIEKGLARLFVGGGITKDSDAVEEWVETCNKTQTMLRVLKPFL